MKSIFNDYGMVIILLVLCLVFSLLTIQKESPDSPSAARAMAEEIIRAVGPEDTGIALGAKNTSSADFVERVMKELRDLENPPTVKAVVGEPRDLRIALEELAGSDSELTIMVATGDTAKWRILEQIPDKFPQFASTKITKPEEGLTSAFLKPSNLLAIVDRIVVIAVIAIGMTLVIITGGIDLSVGSLIALAAVVSTTVMKAMGGLDAPNHAIFVGFAAAILACGLTGLLTGAVVAWLKVAPFIITLGLMMIGRGHARGVTGGFSIYQVPDGLTWLGQGKSLGIPNTVIMLLVLYGFAHFMMTQSKLGRHIYAVGGNREAARLSGVPVRSVLIFVYALSGVMAGLGGCIQASQIATGDPNMGNMYELYVIAAVVVGGTSLAGGSGKIMGTLIGAFIIAVIQNGMNLLGMKDFLQLIVFGWLIIASAAFDQLRRHGGLKPLLSSPS
ncbi:MAG: ABC transporter permease [Verrucomicrobiota bacterium]